MVNSMIDRCKSLDEIRQNIDLIDRKLVKLIAERSSFVSEAAKHKKTVDEVVANQRIDAVIENVKTLAEESGVSTIVIEKVYRAMIKAFTEEELVAFDSRYKEIKDSYY